MLSLPLTLTLSLSPHSTLESNCFVFARMILFGKPLSPRKQTSLRAHKPPSPRTQTSLSAHTSWANLSLRALSLSPRTQRARPCRQAEEYAKLKHDIALTKACQLKHVIALTKLSKTIPFHGRLRRVTGMLLHATYSHAQVQELIQHHLA
jgi:hypothetical protein